MKKFTIIGLAICLAFALAAPAMAVDADFSGAYRVRGTYTEHWNLRDAASNAFMDMRFRLQTVFKATDNLSVTVRFDALDGHTWGTDEKTTSDSITFDRAYMTIKADLGTFTIGRQKGGAFGTKFGDYEGDYDRIKYSKVIDGLTLMAVYQKTTEEDYPVTTTAEGDDDSDKYCLAAIQKMENITAGLMGCWVNNQTNPSQTTRQYSLTPYFVSKFGPIAIEGELTYIWGEIDYDAATSSDTDIKALAYNLEASYNFGPASIMAGYAFISGDADSYGTAATDNHESSAFSTGVGNDWEKLFILTSNELSALYQLGDYGNLSKDGLTNSKIASSSTSYTKDRGAKIIYGGVTFSPLDNLTLGAVIGAAEVDELQAGKSKDDYGIEYDFTLNWKIYDNLTYTAIAAYLEAGDFYWEQTNTTKPASFNDTYALFHQLQLSF